MSRLTLLLLLLLTTGTYTCSFAWNKATHMAIGAIAYRDLRSTTPQTVARVVAILKQHPDYQSRWAAKLNDPALSPDEQDEYLFMLAARWSDDVKEQNNPYNHPTWHYVNFIYAPDLGIIRSDSTLATGENILQAYAQNQAILRGDAPDSAKAIALCWMFHLTGDVAMPLHTTALIDNHFSDGDQGGNKFKIRVTPDGKTINLHSFWDGMLLGAEEYTSVRNLAIQERGSFPRNQLPQLCESGITAWAIASFLLAQDNAYRSHTLATGTDEEGALLPADYVATVKPIAERQVALAGYRLADELIADVRN
jgi:hypothetical protein